MTNIKVYCAGSGKNTGKPACAFNPGLDKAYVLAPLGSDYIEEANFADAATFKTFLNGKLQHANPALRWHYIGPFEGTEDKTVKAAIQTLPNGAMYQTNRSQQAYRYQFTKGGKHYHNALISYNALGEYYRVYRIDNANNWMGTTSSEVDSNGYPKMQGYSLNMLLAEDEEAATATTVTGRFFTISFADASEMNENYYVINAGFNPGSLLGVRDIVLRDVTPGGAASGEHHIQILADGGTINIVKVLGAAAATATNFLFTNQDTGAAVTKTTALNTAGDAVVITASLADADYVDGDNMEILWDLATGGTNGCKWFESPEALVVVAVDP